MNEFIITLFIGLVILVTVIVGTKLASEPMNKKKKSKIMWITTVLTFIEFLLLFLFIT